MPPKGVLIAGATGVLGGQIASYYAEKRSCELLVLMGRDEHELLSLSHTLARADLTIETVAIHGSIAGEMPVPFPDHLPLAAIDLAILSLGSHQRTPLGTIQDSVSAVIESNLTIPLTLTLALAPRMGTGAFILFSDAMIKTPMTGYSAYYAAKSGLEAAVACLATELAPQLRINAVAPGIMNIKPGAPSDAEERWSAKVPLGYLGGVDPVVSALEFLYHNNYLTGTVLTVDGGASLA